MSRKNESNLNFEGITDAQISAAIRYLDPECTQQETSVETTIASGIVLVIWLGVLVLYAVILVYFWEYLRA
jgi:hypothetical protein